MIDDTQVQEPEVQEQQVAEEAPAVETPKPVQQPQPPQETDGERNFRMLRQEKARLDRELEEERRLRKQLEEQQALTSEPSLGDDDIVEGKHYNKVRKEQQQLRNELKAAKEEIQYMTLEARVKARYSDFDQVFTKENIDKLNDQYPELVSSMASDPDKYKQAVNTYTLIKKLRVNEGDPYMEDKQKIQANAVKPRPLASMSPQEGGHPLERANAFANGLTTELQRQLWKEMQECAKGKV